MEVYIGKCVRFSDISDQEPVVATPRPTSSEPSETKHRKSFEIIEKEEIDENLCDSEKLKLSEDNTSSFKTLECEISRKKKEEQEYIEKGIASLDKGSSFISSRNFLLEQGVNLKPQKPCDSRTFLVSTTVVESAPVVSERAPPSPKSFPLCKASSTAHKKHSHPKSAPHRCNKHHSKDKNSSIPMNYANNKPFLFGNPGDRERMTTHRINYSSGDSSYTRPVMTGGPGIGYNPSYMSGGGDASYASNSRLHEKEELKRLNDRFTAYVNRVRNLRESRDNNSVDSVGFIQTAKILEDEIKDLKALYENELDKYRQHVEGLGRDKSALEVQLGKSNQVSMDLHDRLSVETEKNGNLLNDLNSYQQRISQLEQELQDSQEMAVKPQEQLEHLNRDYQNLLREMDTLKRRYEHEQVARQEGENKAHQVAQKLELCEQVHHKEFGNLKDRLEAANDTILTMESKMRGMNKEDINVADILQKVREASELELKKYQMESEENFNRQMTALKAQMDEDAKLIERITLEKQQGGGNDSELRSQIINLEGQVNALTHENKNLASQLYEERQRATEQLEMLNKKLKDLQELLFQKMKELGAARDVNVPLKAEIESLKVILEEEEKRLRMTNGDATPYSTNAVLPAISTTTRSYNLQPVQPPLLGNYTSPYMSQPPVNPNLENVYSSEAEAALPVVNIDPTIRRRTKYIYDTDTSTNRLHMDSESRPVGPITTHRSLQGGNTGYSSIGGGTDYFEGMFRDIVDDQVAALSPKPESSTTHDYTTSTNSAVGDIKIIEVNQDGKYVRLENCGSKDVEFGGFMIQQNVGGHPVAVYRFPPRLTFSSKATLTVWSGSNDPQLHNPPTDFIWKEQLKWGTGPECTTILCRPNGQAVAWTTAAHRFTRNAFEESPTSDIQPSAVLDDEADALAANLEEENLTETSVNVNEPKPEGVYLKRGKVPPPSLSASKHPHGINTSNSAHPHTGQSRPLTFGNDNSTFSRQSRSQTTRPDPIPGQPYAGAPGQRIGSAPLRRYTVKGTGAIANKSAGTIRYGQPTPFLSPLQQEFSQAYNSRATSLVRFST